MKIEILRICQLAPGDEFLYCGLWIRLISKGRRKLKCRYVESGDWKEIIGRNSQQFVQVERKQGDSRP